MNFCPWLDKNLPTELRRSQKESLVPFLPLLLSLSLNKTKKNGIFFPLCPFCSNLILKLREWPTSCHVSNLARVRLYPETIYFISVQVHIIFYELNLTYFPKSHIWALSDTRRPKIHENSIVSKFNEICLSN